MSFELLVISHVEHNSNSSGSAAHAGVGRAVAADAGVVANSLDSFSLAGHC